MPKTVDLDIPHDPAERYRRTFLVGKEEKLMAELAEARECWSACRDEIVRLREALNVSRSLLHGLPRSATAESIDKVISEVLVPET